MTLYENVTRLTELERPKILDFGCGCGRLVRFLSAYSAERSIHACDVNPDHVRWCQENLTDIQTTQCDVLPPLPYQDQTFDLVYSLSVFTHLSESNAREWLSEMHRVLAPQGILIATTAGISTLELIRDSVAQQQMFKLDRSVVVDNIGRLKEERFIFCNYDPDTLNMAKAGEEYGIAFIHPDYLYEEWGSADFEVVDFLSGGLHGYQDIVILRRSF
jgi:ubiquinone/menaquinone biosynthesis C-methylase UbiE